MSMVEKIKIQKQLGEEACGMNAAKDQTKNHKIGLREGKPLLSASSNIYPMHNRNLRSTSTKYGNYLDCKSPMKTSSAWKCMLCTYHNETDDYACNMCFRPKPSSRRMRDPNKER